MSGSGKHPSGGKIILLHGASSSGKSTLARALRARLPEPFWHYSIDHLRDSGVLPLERINSGEFAWSGMRAAFFEGFHSSLTAFAGAGNNLIVEHILDTEGWLERVAELLTPFDVFFIGVRCSVEELERREAARGDRPEGSAAKDFRNVHRGLHYDLEVDGEAPLESNTERVLSAWTVRPEVSVFDRLAGAG